jgi:hypothetical protein
MSSKKHKKFQKINFKPVHPIATFKPIRKNMDLLKKFKISLADLFPPGAKLTGNEFKVLFVLRAAVVGANNIAAIDQEKIAELSGIRRQHVMRAIIGLRRKGVIEKTWMEAGFQMYRNIYSLWTPPEIREQAVESMIKQRDEARELEKKADRKEAEEKLKKARKLREQAEAVREKTCIICGGEGAVRVFSPKEGRDRARWCNCFTGQAAADKAGASRLDFIPDHLFLKVFSDTSNPNSV